MVNFDDLDHPYRILIIRGSGSGKTNLLLNLISQQLYFYKTYIHMKQNISRGIKHLNDSKDCIE